MLLSPSYFFISSFKVPRRYAGHVISLASEKRFRLVDTGHCGMEKNRRVGLHHDQHDLFLRSHCSGYSKRLNQGGKELTSGLLYRFIMSYPRHDLDYFNINPLKPNDL
jgi:hypothetical protein